MSAKKSFLGLRIVLRANSNLLSNPVDKFPDTKGLDGAFFEFKVDRGSFAEKDFVTSPKINIILSKQPELLGHTLGSISHSRLVNSASGNYLYQDIHPFSNLSFEQREVFEGIGLASVLEKKVNLLVKKMFGNVVLLPSQGLTSLRRQDQLRARRIKEILAGKNFHATKVQKMIDGIRFAKRARKRNAQYVKKIKRP